MTTRKKPGQPMEGGRNIGVSRNRVFRCSDELWSAAQTKAKKDGTTVADVLRTALVDFVGDNSVPVMGKPQRASKG